MHDWENRKSDHGSFNITVKENTISLLQRNESYEVKRRSRLDWTLIRRELIKMEKLQYFLYITDY